MIEDGRMSKLNTLYKKKYSIYQNLGIQFLNTDHIEMDFAQQIIQCYQNLISSANVEQSSMILMDFYSQHKAFPVLISILHSNSAEIIKEYAALGLKIALRYRWEENIDKAEFLKPIFLLLMTTNSTNVAKHLVQIVIGLMDDVVYQMIISFANQAANYDPENPSIPNFNFPTAIYSSLCLIDANLEILGIEVSMPLYQKIASIGFQINDATIQIAAISCTFHLTYSCQDDLGFGPVFPQSLALMQSLSGSPLIHDLFTVFSYMMSKSCVLINPHLLIPQLLAIINCSEIHFEERKHAFNVLIDTIDNYSEEIFPENGRSESHQSSDIISNGLNDYSGYIFQATAQIISALFDENDSYDISPYELIEPIADYFSEYENLLQSFWEQIPSLQPYLFGQYLIIVFIGYSCDNGYDFYLPRISEISSMLCSVVSQTASPCLKEASIICLSNFCSTFFEEVTEFKSMIYENVFNCLVGEPSSEIIKAFEVFIKSVGESDYIFPRAFDFFSNMIRSDQISPNLREDVLWCLTELIRNSNNGIDSLFQPIFELFKSIIGMDTKSDPIQNSFKSVAICGFARLCEKSPTLFAPFAEHFANYIITNVSESLSIITSGAEDSCIDSLLLTQCINAYWYIVENIQDATSSTIEQMINMLIQICQIPNAQLTSKMSIPGSNNEISIHDISIRILCGCASKCPSILQNIIGQLLTIIEENLSYHSAVGANWISSAITTLPNRAEVVPQLISILLGMIDTSCEIELTATCLESLSILIEWCGAVVIDNEEVLQSAAKAFNFDLFCFKEKDHKYDDYLHKNAQSVFRHAINALQDGAFQAMQSGSYIDLFLTVAESKSKSMKDLGMQLLADLIDVTPGEQIPTQLLERILEIGFKEANKGNYIGFFLIKKTACSSPFNVNYAETFRSFIPMMIQRLFLNSHYFPQFDPSHLSEGRMIANDNCVSALGAIIVNIFGDSIFETLNIFYNNQDPELIGGLNIPIVLIILAVMPPQIDVSENESILAFFLWLFERAHGRYINEFATVLVKLFTEPIEIMRQNLISDNTLQRLNQILIQILPSCGGEGFCTTVLGGDANKMMILNSYLTPPQ